MQRKRAILKSDLKRLPSDAEVVSSAPKGAAGSSTSRYDLGFVRFGA